ncbi:MAG TPA: hypothetical protein VHP11_14745 [Tepidisphaeraceae bacterium]|nr:hypothetical protein [Tepidisphaeraceae bacterium]
MATFVFLCDLSTEQECLDRRLLGTTPGESHQHHYRKIVVGDQLFLFNYEIGRLRGPFSALTLCTRNIEPKAWAKTKRCFPWQVRVDDKVAFKIPLDADELNRLVTLARTRIGLMPPAELSDQQAGRILHALRQKNSPSLP